MYRSNQRLTSQASMAVEGGAIYVSRQAFQSAECGACGLCHQGRMEAV